VGIQSVHVAPFSHVSRVTRHGLWLLTDFFSILLAAPRFNRKARCKPGIHAAGDVVDMTVAQIGQRFCCNVAAMAGLAIDYQMVLQLGFNKQGSESSDRLTLTSMIGTT
jgi:hypothetical protein